MANGEKPAAKAMVHLGKPIEGRIHWGELDQDHHKLRLRAKDPVEFDWPPGNQLFLVFWTIEGKAPVGGADLSTHGNIRVFTSTKEQTEQRVEIAEASPPGAYAYLPLLLPHSGDAPSEEHEKDTALLQAWFNEPDLLRERWRAEHPRTRRLAEDPPEDPDDPPEIIVGEGTPPPGVPSILLRSPRNDQSFTPDADGRVSIHLDGTILVSPAPGVPPGVVAPDDEHEWLLDGGPEISFTGQTGTITPRLAAGPHTITLRHGPTGQEVSLKIEVAAPPAPEPEPPKPEPQPEPPPVEKPSPFHALLQAIVDFFRRLFGKK